MSRQASKRSTQFFQRAPEATGAALSPVRRKTDTSRFKLVGLWPIQLPADADDMSWPSQCERLAQFNQ